MSKIGGVLVVILSLVAGFGGGWVYQIVSGRSITSTSATPSSSVTATAQSLEECLTEVWGDDKYAAISANSSLATTEDNFLALKCYEEK
ncbi:hypothetical protein HYW32_00715 [Candidatus Berkelbacteria bacterium]|nr:hypothetical protein [Candidatus Berkelbacteria bacterium]